MSDKPDSKNTAQIDWCICNNCGHNHFKKKKKDKKLVLATALFLFVLFLTPFMFAEEIIIESGEVIDSDAFSDLKPEQKEAYAIARINDYLNSAPTAEDLENFKQDAFGEVQQGFQMLSDYFITVLIICLIINDIMLITFLFYCYSKGWF